MTYYNHNYSSSHYTNYEFTAFAESDLVSGNLRCGSSFTMPGCASVCITVKDNDKALSGDKGCWWDDKASDSSGQTAKIDANGHEVGNGGQIYAESYFWVKDQYGNWYVMIEIEQEGSGKDFFTFYNGDGYKTPPAGAKLTVYSECDISGDWLKYSDLGAGKCSPATGDISGTVFCDTNCDGINGIETTVPGCDYRIEAEKMYDCGFQTFYSSTASGGKAVRLKCDGGYGELATCFSGKTGTYDVAIRVQDENDGKSTIKLLVDGKYVEAIRLDKNTDGSGNDNGAYSTYVIKNVAIEDGDTIKLAVWGNGGEYVRIDKIDLKGQDKVVLTDEPTKAGVTVKLVALDGTVVAETTTDANGNYKFDDVPVGQYKIMGVAPDGTHFTIKDAQGNSKDSIDSDVGSDGMSDVITVTKDSKTDIDLGLCKDKLGSLSGRYFCDTDNDDQDNGNGDEPAVAGVEVELLDAAGNGTGITTTTDANGNYQFLNLAAGVYGVLFTDPNGVLAGKTLITANVGDDASDSDAIGDIVSSTITGITVVAGADTPDNDAGVEKLNEQPTATDDAGGGCADELITVDLSDNYADADSAEVWIATLGGLAIADGETILLSGTDSNGDAFTGLEVTRNGDSFTFDGESAFAALDIGEKATASIAFTVADSDGGTTTANIDVTFCGDANSVESFMSHLPTTMTYQLDYALDGGIPFSEHAFDLTIIDADDDRFDGLTIKEAYCLDYNTAVRTIAESSTLNVGTVFGSQTAAALSAFDQSTVSHFNGQAGSQNLDLINWIIAQDFEGQGYSGWEVQFAIWELADNFNSNIVNYANFQNTTKAGVTDILTQAAAHDGFVFTPGDTVGLIVDPGTSDPENQQPFIVAIGWEAYDCLC